MLVCLRVVGEVLDSVQRTCKQTFLDFSTCLSCAFSRGFLRFHALTRQRRLAHLVNFTHVLACEPVAQAYSWPAANIPASLFNPPSLAVVLGFPISHSLLLKLSGFKIYSQLFTAHCLLA